ncbi:MAG: hypothetical protein Q8N63_01255, partial [Nanoarchaeota archaeon]|nr:hypothetical protein [Nanoarchaeota archaeon]
IKKTLLFCFGFLGCMKIPKRNFLHRKLPETIFLCSEKSDICKANVCYLKVAVYFSDIIKRVT